MKCRKAATKVKKYFQVLILFMKKMAFLLKLFFYHQLTLHNPRPWKWTMARDWESIDKINIVVVTGNLVVSSQSRSVASSVISGIIYDIIAVNASFLASGLELQRLTWRTHPPCLSFCSVSVCQLISCLLSHPKKEFISGGRIRSFSRKLIGQKIFQMCCIQTSSTRRKRHENVWNRKSLVVCDLNCLSDRTQTV
jgi:hypothetical protein